MLLILFFFFALAQPIAYDFIHYEYVWGPAWGMKEQWWIHGGWPGWENGTWPEWCGCSCSGHIGPNFTNCSTYSKCFPPYNETELGLLQIPMQKWWASIDNLWEHEWKKHGTCTVLPLQEYFWDILKTMLPVHAPNISGRSFITTTEIQNAWPTRIGIGCSQNYLTSFFFCRNRTNLIDCPLSSEMCSGNLTILQLTNVRYV